MKTFSHLGLAVAGAAVVGSVATVLSPGSAYAASLNGSITFTNGVTGFSNGVNPGSDDFDFGGATIGATSGDFDGVTLDSLTSAFTLTRISILDGNNSDGFTSALYSFGAIPNFFTLSNGYSFALDAGSLIRNRFQQGGLISVTAGGALSGTFFDGSNEVAGFGTLAITSVPKSSGYSISLNTVPIPTPALLPGLIGMGVAALRRKQEESADAEA